VEIQSILPMRHVIFIKLSPLCTIRFVGPRERLRPTFDGGPGSKFLRTNLGPFEP
jgi:hypothetical protein